MGRQKSIVLVTVDCLRADHTGFGGYRRPTTPFLDSLAGESFVFPAAIVAGTPTYYSLPAIHAARAPLALGRDVLGIAPGEPTLASALKQAGYATAAYSAGNPYISPRFGYQQGFDVFRDFPTAEANGAVPHDQPSARNGQVSYETNWRSRLNWRLQKVTRQSKFAAHIYDEFYFQYCQRWAVPPAESLDQQRRFPAADTIVDFARSWVASVGEQPFFLWLHLMDPHAPYFPKQEALELMGKKVPANRARYLNSYWLRQDLDASRLARCRDEIITLYDAGIRWVDVQVCRLVDTLRTVNLWENCVFALTADHGEEFLDHGRRYHVPADLMEELIRVPLLLRVPGVEKRPTESPFSLADLAPTLADAAQAQTAAMLPARSRWGEIQRGSKWDEPALVESTAGCTNPFQRHSSNRLRSRIMAVREVRYKLVVELNLAAERLYDLEADPRELRPIPVNTDKSVRRRLLQHAHTHIERWRTERDRELVLRARLAELRLEWANSMHTSETIGF